MRIKNLAFAYFWIIIIYKHSISLNNIQRKTIPIGIPKQFWYGGSESFMFNAMEKIATSPNPKTPVLGCEIPDSLLPEYVGTNVCFLKLIS